MIIFFQKDLPTGDYRINLFLKYIITGNSPLRDLSSSDLNQLYKINKKRSLRSILI